MFDFILNKNNKKRLDAFVSELQKTKNGFARQFRFNPLVRYSFLGSLFFLVLAGISLFSFALNLQNEKVADAAFVNGDVATCNFQTISAVGQRNAPPSQPNTPGAISYSGSVVGYNANNLGSANFSDFNGAHPAPNGWFRNSLATRVEVPPETELVFYAYMFNSEYDFGPIRVYESYQLLQNKDGGPSLSQMGAPQNGNNVPFKNSALSSCWPNACTRNGEYYAKNQNTTVATGATGKFETMEFTTARTARILSKTAEININTAKEAILTVDLEIRNESGFNANLNINQPAIPGSTGNTYSGSHTLNAGQTNTISYDVNLGPAASLPANVTVPMTTVTDPDNRTVVLSDQLSGSVITADFYSRTMWVLRSSGGSASTGTQPDYPHTESRMEVTLKSYSTYSDEIEAEVPASDLGIEKIVDTSSAKEENGEFYYNPGDTVTYIFRVDNSGPKQISSFVLNEVLPAEIPSSGISNWRSVQDAGAGRVSTATNIGSMNASDPVNPTWENGLLNPGQDVYIMVDMVISDTVPEIVPNAQNEACVTDGKDENGENTVDTDDSNNCDDDRITIIPRIDLTIEKTASSDRVETEADVTYKFKVTNNGEANTYGFEVKETWPSELDPNSFRNWRVDNSDTNAVDPGSVIDADKDSFEWSGQLNAGQYISFLVDATVIRDIDEKTIATNSVCVEDPEFPDGSIIEETDLSNNCDDTQIEIIPTVDIWPIKEVVPKEPDPYRHPSRGDSPYRPGEVVNYTITINNDGPATVYAMDLTDTHSDLLNATGWSIVTGETTAENPGELTVDTSGEYSVLQGWTGKFKEGEVIVIQATFVIDEDIDTTTSADNTLCVDTPEFEDGEEIRDRNDTPENNDCDPEDIPIIPPTELELFKTIVDGKEQYQPGDTVKFKLEINNNEIATVTRFRLDEYPEYISHLRFWDIVEEESTATDPGSINEDRDTFIWNGTLKKDESVIFTFEADVAGFIVGSPFVGNEACIPIDQIEDSLGTRLDDKVPENNCDQVEIPIESTIPIPDIVPLPRTGGELVWLSLLSSVLLAILGSAGYYYGTKKDSLKVSTGQKASKK